MTERKLRTIKHRAAIKEMIAEIGWVETLELLSEISGSVADFRMSKNLTCGTSKFACSHLAWIAERMQLEINAELDCRQL